LTKEKLIDFVISFQFQLGDLSFPPPPPPPPPPSSSSIPGVPKIDTSVPPPSIPFPPDAYQNWALQWSIFQAQQAAVYQTQLYQSFTNQQKANPTPVPPTTPPVNNNNNAQSKWQLSSKHLQTIVVVFFF